MSEEYTVVHQWGKVKTDFGKVMKDPYKYVEDEFDKALSNVRAADTIAEGIQDLDSLLNMLKVLNTIYSPVLKN